MPISPPGNTLAAIQVKVRRLTRTPSQAQLTDNDLNNYINTFIQYDFPEHLRTFNLRQQFTFTCNPYQDVYYTDELSYGESSAPENNDLYNFQNKYLTMHPPVYIAGYQSFFTQSREQFFGIYPNVNNISAIGPTGDGVTTTFSGVINSQQSYIPAGTNQQITLLKNQVLFSSVDVNGNGLAMVDVPVLDFTTGNPTIYGNLYISGTQPTVGPVDTAPYVPGTGAIFANNYINYFTGEFVVTFPTAPESGVTINSQTVPEICSLPQALCFYQNRFILRPVPDQPYRINFEVYMRPAYFIETTQTPQLEEWWQYIAYGAAKKILEDRLDMETVALILPEYKKQESLVLRRTIVQYTNERVATIYTEQTNSGAGGNGWGWGGSNF